LILDIGEYLPFRDGSFDAVFSMAVLEHVRDPFRCAREITRVLKAGARLICCIQYDWPRPG
jgi:ubiquinone/menaquinone biosynthesis C-methylase UbiE